MGSGPGGWRQRTCPATWSQLSSLWSPIWGASSGALCTHPVHSCQPSAFYVISQRYSSLFGHPTACGVPGPGIRSELQQHQIFNPRCGARDGTCVPALPRFCRVTAGTPHYSYYYSDLCRHLSQPFFVPSVPGLCLPPSYDAGSKHLIPSIPEPMAWGGFLSWKMVLQCGFHVSNRRTR